MAFSNSIKRSQDILICGLCDVNTKVKVKCMDCDLYLCDACEGRHSRFKHADSHSVLAIRDIYLHKEEEGGSKEFKPVKCKIHKAQFCSIFCITCECLICPICNIERHQKHDLEKIDIACKKKYEKLIDLENAAEKRAQMFLQNLRKNNYMKYNEIEKILEVKIQRIQELQNRHIKRQTEIRENKAPQRVLDTEDKILKEEKNIKEETKEIKKILEAKNTEKFLDAANILEDRLETFCESLDTNKRNFEPLQSISGDYTPLFPMSPHTNIELTKLKSFSLVSYSVCSIASNDTDSVWIVDDCERNIQHVDLSKGIKISQKHKFPEGELAEIRCFNAEEIFLAISTKIFHMTADGKFNIVKDFSPSKVNTLHLARNSDIVVGMDMSDRKEDQLVIAIISRDGKTKYEYRNFGGHLLQKDFVRCCTCLNGDVICYIDSTIYYPCNGRLVLLDKNGYLQWTYYGNPTINTKEHPFIPVELVSTRDNNIITSDKNQNALHILTSTGSLLTIMDLSLLGIWAPGVMALVSNQCFWIKGKDNHDHTILFKMKILGI